MSIIDKLVEGRMKAYEASDEGRDNPYKGKPLQLDKEKYDQHWLPKKILKNAGVVPPWLALERDIKVEKKDLMDQWQELNPEEREERLGKLNEMIRRYNLIVPIKTKFFFVLKTSDFESKK